MKAIRPAALSNRHFSLVWNEEKAKYIRWFLWSARVTESSGIRQMASCRILHGEWHRLSEPYEMCGYTYADKVSRLWHVLCALRIFVMLITRTLVLDFLLLQQFWELFLVIWMTWIPEYYSTFVLKMKQTRES